MREGQLKGAAVFQGVACSKALRAYISKKFDQWFEDQKFGLDPKTASYKVSFERRGEGHEIFCYTEILEGDVRLWVAADYGESPHDALVQCLRRNRLH